MRAVAGARGRAIVLVNAVEAEPPSLKDRTLLEVYPHLVLDGAVLAAEALGADEALLAVGEHAGSAAASAYEAIEERARERAGRPVTLTLASVGGGYIAGQETALINALEGRPPIPDVHARRCPSNAGSNAAPRCQQRRDARPTSP